MSSEPCLPIKLTWLDRNFSWRLCFKFGNMIRVPNMHEGNPLINWSDRNFSAVTSMGQSDPSVPKYLIRLEKWASLWRIQVCKMQKGHVKKGHQGKLWAKIKHANQSFDFTSSLGDSGLDEAASIVLFSLPFLPLSSRALSAHTPLPSSHCVCAESHSPIRRSPAVQSHSGYANLQTVNVSADGCWL